MAATILGASTLLIRKISVNPKFLFTARKRVLLLGSFIVAGVGFVSDVGNVRDTVCKLAITEPTCIRLGLLPSIPPPPQDIAKIAASARAALLGKVEGVWGLPARDGKRACRAKFNYVLEHRGSDDFIQLRGIRTISEARVVTAADGVIFTRTITPVADAGTQWELKPDGDRLVQVDAKNVSTTLVRCSATPP